jgi:Chaperone of endosialidase
MPHMLAQEHMNFVDALRYGTARTEVTLAAAISGIGSAQCILVLTVTGDGVWTIGSNLTVPGNITLWIPPGVTVNRATGVILTVQGQLISWSPGWETGPGTTVRTFAPAIYTEFTRLVSQLGVYAPFSGICFAAGVQGQDQIVVTTNVAAGGGSSAGNSVIQYVQSSGGSIWEAGVSAVAHQYYIGRIASPGRIIVADGGVGISNGTAPVTPTHALHMGQDDAFKATASWTTPSDAQLKTVQGTYDDGLTTVLALPQPVRFVFNGKAGTPSDGKEQIGMIAQDVQGVAPYMITTYQDKLAPEDPAPTDILSMNNGPMVYMLVNAVKDLAAQVDALTTRVAALEAKVP